MCFVPRSNLRREAARQRPCSHSSWFWTCCSGWPWPWRRMPRRCPGGSLSIPFLSYTRLVLGERSPLGRAAALLARCPPPTALSKLGPAVRCRSSPEFPFRFILYLGPRSVNVVSLRKRPNSLYLQNKLSRYPGALQHLSSLRHSAPALRHLPRRTSQ